METVTSSLYSRGYVALCNEPPFRLDLVKSSEEFQIPNGDLLQKVYVWRETESQIDQQMNELVVPLRDIVHGAEGEEVFLNLGGTPCNLMIMQQKSPYSEKKFEDAIKSINCFIRPAQFGEREAVVQKMNIHSYKAVIHWSKDNIPRGSISAQMTASLWFSGCEKNLLRPTALSTLNDLYKKLSLINTGTRGAVYQVKNQDGNIRALKITNDELHPDFNELATIINHLLNTEETIHLTRIYNLFEMNKDKLSELKDDVIENTGNEENGKFKAHDIKNPKITNKFYVIEMECMEGDLNQLWEEGKISPIERLAIRVQIFSTLSVLGKYHTYAHDIGFRNIMIKELNESDTFKGKRLMDYDYWKYIIGDQEIHIPKMKYLIKMGDYDQWYSKIFYAFYKANTPTIKSLASMYSFSPFDEGFYERFPKPADPQAKILAMN